MTRKEKTPRVVAELGRPETPAETAARKANDSRLYRQRKTVNNLVFSLLVSLGLVLVIVLVVPRGTGDFADRSVDVSELAQQASPVQGYQLIAPETPEGWKAKQSELRHSELGDVTYWYIGYTTADNQYASVVQAFTANGAPVPESWIAEQFEQQTATGTEQHADLTWTVYDHSDRSAEESNVTFGLHGETPGGTILISGTDSPDTLRQLADRVAPLADAAAPTTPSDADAESTGSAPPSTEETSE